MVHELYGAFFGQEVHRIADCFFVMLDDLDMNGLYKEALRILGSAANAEAAVTEPLRWKAKVRLLEKYL